MSDDIADVADRVALALSGADVQVFTRAGQPWFAINDMVEALGTPGGPSTTTLATCATTRSAISHGQRAPATGH